ncbi:hypothetical protein Rs2_36033 [Raphanus sativus]|nr:hypothetical protein Rs2_36033 [Raphanus sativus]
MIEPLVKLLKELEDTIDCMTVLIFIATLIVFLVSSFPYKKHIRDWQRNEFRVAASDHKILVFLFCFLCGASTPNENCDQNQTSPGFVVLRFLIKSGYAMTRIPSSSTYILAVLHCILFSLTISLRF